MNANNKRTSPFSKTLDDIYFEIWKIEQEHTRTRWNVATFFFSVSFAIFGLSFLAQVSPASATHHVQRFVGVILYWFAYILFMQFNRYTNYLRGQLRKMEESDLVTFSFQIETKTNMYSRFTKLFSATRLLFYFGILYTVGAVLLIVFPI